RSRHALQLRNAADMINMLMAVEQDLHVARAEPELADIGRDQVRAGLGPAVYEDVAVAAGDQDRRDAAGTDEVSVRMDPHRRRRLVPIVPILARRREQRTIGLEDRRRMVDLRWRLAERNDDLLR